ncbi:PRC-barrel domain-containing protein [Pseudomonas putida]
MFNNDGVLTCNSVHENQTQTNYCAELCVSTALCGHQVFTVDGTCVGKLSDIVVDVRAGKIAYAILSEGGYFGSSSLRHAIPWEAMTLHPSEKSFRLAITAARLSEDPDFETSNWPSLSEDIRTVALRRFYKIAPGSNF